MKTIVATSKELVDTAQVLNAVSGYPLKGKLAGEPTGGEVACVIPDEPYDKEGRISPGWTGYEHTEQEGKATLLVDDGAIERLHDKELTAKLSPELAVKLATAQTVIPVTLIADKSRASATALPQVDDSRP